jgi:hypothetical protein
MAQRGFLEKSHVEAVKSNVIDLLVSSTRSSQVGYCDLGDVAVDLLAPQQHSSVQRKRECPLQVPSSMPLCIVCECTNQVLPLQDQMCRPIHHPWTVTQAWLNYVRKLG